MAASAESEEAWNRFNKGKLREKGNKKMSKESTNKHKILNKYEHKRQTKMNINLVHPSLKWFIFGECSLHSSSDNSIQNFTISCMKGLF